MPMYSYRCNRCDITQERVRHIEDRRNTVYCPRCRRHMSFTITTFNNHTWQPLELELETGKPTLYTSKKMLKADCNRLGKHMPGQDIE